MNNYISLARAAKLAPGRPSTHALWRWCRKGIAVRGSDERVRLRHVKVGRQIHTTQEWLEEFFQATADRDLEHFDNQTRRARRAARKPRTSRQREESIKRERAYLDGELRRKQSAA